MKIFGRTIRCWIAVLALGCCALAEAATYRIEPEDFTDVGKWTIARGNGITQLKQLYANQQTGAVAQTDIDLPEGGKYYLWVRAETRNGGYRTADIKINGKKAGKYGDDKLKDFDGQAAQIWKMRKLPIELPAGKNHIEIIANSNYTRIDCLLLTTDKDFVAPTSIPDAENIPQIKIIGDKVVHVNLPTKGEKKNPPVIVFHGGRPWTANTLVFALAQAGAYVTRVDSVNLNGLGGASIKAFLEDKVEPKANDGITPAFQNLAKYKVAIFTSIPTENMAKIFTPERIEKLKQYVENGGSVVFSSAVPKNLQEILPVNLDTADTISGDDINFVLGTRPDDQLFNFLPEKFLLVNGTVLVQPTDDAQVWSYVTNSDGEKLGAFIAAKEIGKGKVIYFAFDWKRISGLKQYFAWAYGKQLITAIISKAGNIGLKPEKLADYSPVPAKQPKDDVSISITDPQMELVDREGVAKLEKIDGKTVATLPGGAKIFIDAKGKAAIAYPGQDKASIKYREVPTVRFFAAMEKLTSDTAEAVDDRVKYSKQKAPAWNLDDIRVDGATVVLDFSNQVGKISWQFKPGSLDLDGRHYEAVAERVDIKEYAGLLQTIAFEYGLKFGDTLAGHRAKRLACYAPPRGYTDMDFSGKVDASTSRYAFFGAGQPFSWVTTPQSIFATFVENPICANVIVSIKKGAPDINETLEVTFGRRKAPIATPYIWHVFSDKPENGHNDWMAIYQFLRHYYRTITGLKEIPSIPTASHSNTTAGEQRDKALAAAKELGFQQFHMQRCPSSIDSTCSEGTIAWYQKIRNYGLIPRPWTPADYTHGDHEKIQERKELFLYNADGQIFSYFGKHPVLDMGNPETYKWYTSVIDKAVEGGMGAIYTDMGGALTNNINFAGEESGTGLDAIIPIYRYYHSKGIQFGIEGMTPLGLNSFWYRRQKYEPFYGNEFSLIGSLCYSNDVDDIDLDYFRLAMYDSFMLNHVEGYANNFERRPEEINIYKRIGKLNPKINEALKVTVMPFIRDIPCGTSWVGENGAAVFCYDPVKKLTVEYNGKTETFEDVPGDTIIILNK